MTNVEEERYKRIKKLGTGNQGTVWLVESVNTKIRAAMKVYPAGGMNAKREMDILRQFGGKGVPYLIDYLEEKESVHIIMEYVEGKTLRNMMKQKKIWSEKECIAIIYEVAKVLQRFHQQSPILIYGDLKPENIMIGENGNVYLIDFGSVLAEGEKNRKVYGTRAYIPPEEEKITPYRDTYALGVLMYEMLTGEVLRTGIQTKKADVSHLSSTCREIMQKAVRIRREAGYQDAGQMCEALKKCKQQLKEENLMKKVLKNRKHRSNKKDYYITDLKRVVLHGYKKGLCLAMAVFVLFGIWASEKEIKAAELEVRESEVSESEVRESEVSESEVIESENEKIQADTMEQDEIPRDEFGRKLVIRK